MSARVAIMAGAGGELGRVTAQKLAAAGFTVAGVDRSEDGLKQLPDGIRRVAADPAAARAAVDRAGPPKLLAHAVPPEAIADLIAYLIRDAAVPVSGAIVPAYGA